jgi:hypothetical protein
MFARKFAPRCSSSKSADTNDCRHFLNREHTSGQRLDSCALRYAARPSLEMDGEPR